MKATKSARFVISLFVAFAPFLASALDDSDSGQIERFKSAGFLASADSAGWLKYAPDREVQVLHLALDVTPDFKKRTIQGIATIRFRPIAQAVREVRLDAVDLEVKSVQATEKIQGYQVTADKIIVTFADPLPAGREAGLTITYSAEPAQGLYFRTPEMGYKEGDTHLFSQGEEIEARHWYPCFDSPNEKFTSEVTCRAPEGMTVVSNGRLVSREKDPATGLEATHWSQEQPHANYLITLVAGYFKQVEDRHKEVPLAFLTPASEINEAPSSFRDTKDVMEFFEEETGVPYPWAKYDQICVNDFVAGGMENTSATTLTDNTLFTGASENIRDSSGLVSHEMAHQWFGDLVTCKDWSDIWLNEGFATYYALLYDGHKYGRDSMLYGLLENARSITSMPNDTNAIVRRNYGSPSEMFGYLAYPKGAWVLRMLRSELGPDLYRRCIKTYVGRHRYGNVVTEDLRAVIEELSGRSYDQFFDQWLYHAHQPELDAAYSWDEKSGLARISIRQTQKTGETVLLFDVPLTIRFKGGFGVEDRVIRVRRPEEDFYFPLKSAPEIVRLDPDLTLLAKTTFPVPTAMLYAQLTDKQDMVGRLLAIEQLSGRKDRETVAKLKQRLNEDGFYGARVQASRALRSIHTDEALEALAGSLRQPDARVRRQVVTDLGGFYSERAYAAARETIEREKNPDILVPAISSLAAYAKPETRETLLKYLESDSFRNELADAAIGAMRLQDNPEYTGPLIEALSAREAVFTTRGFAAGIRAVAYLARNAEKKDRAREFVLRYVNAKKRPVQIAALASLGTLGDPAGLAVLETYASASKESPERTAAEQAVSELRAGRKPVDDFKNLRQEVLDLEKSNRDLKKELDDLKKKVEAGGAATPGPNKKDKPAGKRNKN